MLLMQSCDNIKAKGAADLCHCTRGKKPKGSHGACADSALTLHLTYLLLHYTLRPPPSFRRHRHRRPYHPWHRLSCPRLPSHRPPPSSCSSQPRSNLSIFFANASASALSSVMITLSKMVPPLTCQRSNPTKPMSSNLYTASSSSYSGFAIFLASQKPL